MNGILITTKIKLLPKQEQYQALKRTMEQFNQACNRISIIAYESNCFSKVKLQQLCYYPIRIEFENLSSQLIIRAIAKVCEAYKLNKKTKCQFKLDGAIVYDQRILSLKGLGNVSLATVEGRIKVPMFISGYHISVMQDRRIRGQADLVFVNGVFYLLLVLEIPEGERINTSEVLGIDLGIVNIATDSKGEFFSGAKINNLRKRYSRLRTKLQSKGTKAAKRRLQQRARKERRMARDINHCISKNIVEKAQRHSSVIALENLNGISKNKQKSKTVMKSQRQRLSRWSFFQLRQFIEYKARMNGVPVVFVDPKYTSQECSSCGHTDKENRKTQDQFECVSCGFVANADYNASLNIRRRAIVS
ncbi:transposase [Paenibacillus sp. FSL R7-0312]|uniref:RNA-guided endonuclease InsQ/TnpB family protein n=1 Tax=Paenibacillus sp. FSL R7-0312 TaxID=2921682 RepID=UPI0030FBA62E